MENKRFLTAQDVMEMLGVSLSYSYKLIRRLNSELEADGFVTIKGRVSTQYFMKRIYGLSTDKVLCEKNREYDADCVSGCFGDMWEIPLGLLARFL